MKTLQIDYSDIAPIIEGLYFGVADEDLSHTEDLLDYLRKHDDMCAVINVSDAEEAE